MRKIEIQSCSENLIHLIAKDWAIVTVQDEKKVNGMTVSWGQFGQLWNKNVVTVYIRPQRYTYPLIESVETFSLAFFSEEHRENLAYLGKVSGRDEDKLEHCGYTTSLLEGIPCIDQAKLVLLCRKCYVQDLKKECFADQEIVSHHYPNHDFHRSYVCEILAAYTSD